MSRRSADSAPPYAAQPVVQLLCLACCRSAPQALPAACGQGLAEVTQPSAGNNLDAYACSYSGSQIVALTAISFYSTQKSLTLCQLILPTSITVQANIAIASAGELHVKQALHSMLGNSIRANRHATLVWLHSTCSRFSKALCKQCLPPGISIL